MKTWPAEEPVSVLAPPPPAELKSRHAFVAIPPELLPQSMDRVAALVWLKKSYPRVSSTAKYTLS